MVIHHHSLFFDLLIMFRIRVEINKRTIGDIYAIYGAF